jgi:hypothetical protein
LSDGKDSSEKQQARNNIGSTSATPQVIPTAGAINDLVVTSNHLVFTGADVVLSGIVAGLNGEEITILNVSGTNLTLLLQSVLSTVENRFNGSVVVPNLSVLRIKYRTTTNRWFFENVGVNDRRYVRKDVADTKTGNLTLNDSLLIPTGGIQAISSSTSANNGGSFRFGEAGVESFRIGRDNVTGGGFGTNQFIRRVYFYDRVDFRTGGSLSGVNTAQINTATGRIFHSRSGAANESIRRDEQRLFYVRTITTVGTINSLVLQYGIFNYRFTAATSITGFNPDDIGQSIIIQNASSGTLTLVHESSLSIGGMKIRIIGGSNLVIPIEGKVTLIYVTENRWEILSKNF